MSKKDFFLKAKGDLTEQRKALQKVEEKLMLWRILAFVGALLLFAAGYDGYAFGYGAGGLLLFVFALLVRRHGRVRERISSLSDRLKAVEDFLARREGSWRELAADGAGFQREELPQGQDLHIFGRASLFQYLCLARTAGGRERLADVLSPFPESREVILARQQAAMELARDKGLALKLAGLLLALPDNHDLTPLAEKIRGREPEGLAYAIAKKLRYALPLLPWLALLGCLFGACPLELALALWGLNLALSLWAVGAHGDILAPLLEINHALRGYEGVFLSLEEFEPKSPYLHDLRRHFLGETEGKERSLRASLGLRKLAGLSERFRYRQNILAFVLLNALFLMDSHLAVAFLEWQRGAGRQLSGWLSALQEVEMLLSLSVPALLREKTSLPILLEGNAPRLRAVGAESLLIDEGKAVGNGADFKGESVIITGSNMSGKTTYMRTLAGTAVLAYAGAAVPAESFELSLMDIYTSIQVSDDLSKGISTFYAELLRVRQMVEAAERGRPMLCCIDEIFKGTNSADRIVGAKAAINCLARPHILALITTHDFELCDLRTPQGEGLRNFHFEEHYENDKIEFDFKLKEGRCTTTNAQYLLKMAGIMAD